MGLGDLFKAKKNEELQARVRELEALMTPELQDSLALQRRIEEQHSQLDALEKQYLLDGQRYDNDIQKLTSQIRDLQDQIEKTKSELIETDEVALMQSFALYEPHFSFANSTGYKEALSALRERQKEAIKNGRAATGSTSWTVNGSASQGKKMVKDMQKLLIRAFNCECDDAVEHAKFNNIETLEKRIQTVYSSISKLGSICGVAITGYYRDLKLDELHMAHEYQIEKQKEKERLRELRAEERERVKLEKELAEARKKLEKEEKHYQNALVAIDKQIAEANPEDLPALMEKKREIEGKVAEISDSRKAIDYREANQKAGYVYIISNVGAFGEGIYKIGMTRRLEPMDRINELGDASVPFNFDVHALIFSEDAPGLEAALHRAFEDKKLNMVNTRREFFRVSLDEIKEVVKNNFDKTVEFVDVAPAEQYRTSELMRGSRQAALI